MSPTFRRPSKDKVRRAIDGVVAVFSGRINSEEFLPVSHVTSGGRIEIQAVYIRRDSGLCGRVQTYEAHKRPRRATLYGDDLFCFYSYDSVTDKITQGKSFTAAAPMPQRMHRLNLMVDGSHIPVQERERAAEGREEGADPGSPVYDQALGDDPPESLPLWQKTYNTICEAQRQLQFPAELSYSIEEVNARGERGLALLGDAIETIPRFSGIQQGSGPKTFEDLRVLIDTESLDHEEELMHQWGKERRNKA
ncbi:hypothetical protein B0H16DRAFT_1451046 [Mycena metata]|uniref:Uncharacterized protein n=1 Tax=Mycena metata TaxID=1033252 RepID=A0AAD7JW68_9AGAR|nr:hypothetical protein B0H16DRAFT_1451046 [Mycena metata]